VGQVLVLELDLAAHRVDPRHGSLARLPEADRSLVLVRLALREEPLHELARDVGRVELEADVAVPVDAEPRQRPLDLVARLGDLAARVGVLDTPQDLTDLLPREQPVEEEGADAADVEEA